MTHRDAHEGGNPRLALIWSNEVLPLSQTFVRNQAQSTRTWTTQIAGMTRVDSPLSRADDVIVFGQGHADSLFRRLAYWTGYAPGIRRVIERYSADLVHAHFSNSAWTIARSAVSVGVPLIVTAHGFDVTGWPRLSGLRGYLNRLRLRYTFHRAAVVIAVSEHVRRAVIAAGADPAKVIVHYTGIPLRRDSAPRAAADQQWDVAFVGRLVAKKGVIDLLQAAALVNARRECRLVICGEGPLRGEAERLSESLGVPVTFLGALPASQVAEVLDASALVAAPSKTAANGDTEGLPTVILEAMAAGRPVVATRHAGIPEAVLHGETGLLSVEGDIEALAANLYALLEAPDTRVMYGSAGRERVQQLFDIDTQAVGLEKIYDSVTGAAGR
ncbi:MAG TPA: glycosyl transferase family 1 [Microbacterium sp.]|nr:glycosyl transferase family 1 [Microbacterium sp.]